jgi:hypothetical protein
VSKHKLNSIKKVYLVSFSSILIFCLIIFSLLAVIRFIRVSINNAAYQKCLEEQKKADKIAVTYIPTIIAVSVKRNNPSLTGIDQIVIEGKINNSNISKLQLNTWSGAGDGGLLKSFRKNPNGEFVYKITTVTGNNGAINPNLNISIIPHNKSITCSSDSKLVRADACTLDGLSLQINHLDGSWCLSGKLDLGLGSAPLSIMTNQELLSIGLSESEICNRGNSNWRNKCNKKQIPLFPFN